MSLVVIILMTFLFSSCSTVNKYGPYKVFKVKNYNLDSDYVKWNIRYWTTTENDEHCFESNPDNKEIVTVAENYTQYAIDHFYKRLVPLDVNVHRYAHYNPHVEVTTQENVEFQLETASCIFKSFGGIFSSAVKTRHVSFRLKNK